MERARARRPRATCGRLPPPLSLPLRPSPRGQGCAHAPPLTVAATASLSHSCRRHRRGHCFSAATRTVTLTVTLLQTPWALPGSGAHTRPPLRSPSARCGCAACPHRRGCRAHGHLAGSRQTDCGAGRHVRMARLGPALPAGPPWSSQPRSVVRFRGGRRPGHRSSGTDKVTSLLKFSQSPYSAFL